MTLCRPYIHIRHSLNVPTNHHVGVLYVALDINQAQTQKSAMFMGYLIIFMQLNKNHRCDLLFCFKAVHCCTVVQHKSLSLK